MKKIKLLAPILTISGLGAVVAPLVSLTSCGGEDKDNGRIIQITQSSMTSAKVKSIEQNNKNGIKCTLESLVELKYIDTINVSMDNGGVVEDLNDGDYTFTNTTGVLEIPKATLDAHQGSVTITANLKWTKDAPKIVGSKYDEGHEGECIVNLTEAGKESAEEIEIPEKIKVGSEELLVTGIGNFYGYKANTIKFANADKITFIGNGAFRNSNLKSFTVPNNVTILPNYCFEESSIEEIIFDSSKTKLTTINEQCFSRCTSLKSLNIPKSVTTIIGYAFYECGETLKTITFERTNSWMQTGSKYEIELTVTDPQTNATNLKNCDNLPPNNWGNTGLSTISKLQINDDGLVKMKNDYLQSTDDIVIPTTINGKTVVGVQNQGFQTSKASKITFESPSNITTIGELAFGEMTNLNTISTLDSVTNLGKQAFKQTALTSLPFTEKAVIEDLPDECFTLCTALASINIPASVKTIGGDTFSSANTDPKPEVTLTFAEGSNLESIGSRAFIDINITNNIVLPANLKSIGVCAFLRCSESESKPTINFANTTGWGQPDYTGSIDVTNGTTNYNNFNNFTEDTAPTGTNWARTGIVRS